MGAVLGSTYADMLTDTIWPVILHMKWVVGLLLSVWALSRLLTAWLKARRKM